MSKPDNAYPGTGYTVEPYSDTVPITAYGSQADSVHILIDGEDSPFRWTWSNMVCTMLSMLCCCCPVGLVGVIFSAKAFVSHGLSQFKKARKEQMIAKKLAMIGLILGIVIITAYVILEVAVVLLIVQSTKEQGGTSNSQG